MQNGPISPQLDLAIVGAEVSGLYSGWRWMTSPAGRGTRSAVFECSERVGGHVELRCLALIIGGVTLANRPPTAVRTETL